MLTNDYTDLKPLYDDRIDKFTMVFGSGGKLQLLKW